MRRFIVTAFTFGSCAISLHASAKPRVSSAFVSNAKGAAPPRALPPESDDSVYAKLVEAADADHDAEVSSTELESLVHKYVQKQLELRFQRLDRNRDGRVTRGEVPSMLAQRFARLDANGDGAFTIAELGQVMHQQATERCRVVFARLDLDADGALSASDRDSAKPTRLTKREVPTPRDERQIQR